MDGAAHRMAILYHHTLLRVGWSGRLGGFGCSAILWKVSRVGKRCLVSLIVAGGWKVVDDAEG